MEKKMKHMEMIQAIITRMASNSFALKGWAVTLVAALFALASKDANPIYYLITYIPILVFWGLDAYYLSQERKFRWLYNKVRKMAEDQIDFNMSTAIKPEDLEGMSEEEKEDLLNSLTVFACFRSITIYGFYLPLAGVTLAVVILTLLF